MTQLFEKQVSLAHVLLNTTQTLGGAGADLEAPFRKHITAVRDAVDNAGKSVSTADFGGYLTLVHLENNLLQIIGGAGTDYRSEFEAQLERVALATDLLHAHTK